MKWQGLMKILEINHISNNKILYQQKNIKNTLHSSGEEFIIRSLFDDLEKTETYYIGLDNRSSLNVSDTLSTAYILEPNQNSYERQSASIQEFSITTNSSGNVQANSPVISFRSIGGPWGPVKNIFLTTSLGSSGYLISSARLSQSLTVNDGEIITMRMSFTLKDCN
jgi:hypothetical protein